jgi:hypothetical protein
MAVTETIEFDLDLIDHLIADEETALEPKHRASIEYRTVAERHVAGGVAATSGISTATSTSTITSGTARW